MGLMTRNLLLFVIAASVLLAILSVYTWGHVWTHGEFVGPVGVWAVRGPDMHNVSGIGDGTVLLFGAVLTLVLAVYAWVAPVSRRAAGVGIAIAGFAMCAIAVYDCAHVGGVDFGALVGFVPGEPWVRLTIVPYLVAANAFIIGVAGTLALLPERNNEREFSGAQHPLEGNRMVGETPQRALRMLIYACALVIVLAFVPWVDVHAFHAVVGYNSVTVGLGDATLLALLALGGVILALHMLRDQSEFVWALLVVVAGTTFVVIGHDLAKASADCQSSSYLGFLSNPGCVAENTNMLSISNGIAFLWCSMALSLFTLLLALALPIIEMNSRERAT